MKIKNYKGAGVMLFRYNERNNCYEALLARRALRNGYGKWAVVGGGMEKRDKDFEDCAYREFREETGVSVGELSVCKLAVVSTELPLFHWRTFILLASGPCPEFIPDHENFEFRWFPLSLVPGQDLWIKLNREIKAFNKAVEKCAPDLSREPGSGE